MLAADFWLGRYDLLLSDHGQLMVGIDYVQQNFGLPLQTAKAGAAILAALLVLGGRRKLAMFCAVVLVIDWLLPPLVSALYVKPNELTLEKPFIERHMEATRAAFGLDRHSREIEFPAKVDGTIDFERNKPLLDNVRLWDWRAFHDTLSQTQPLRPYSYENTDVDRYQIDGQLRQVLLAPRELDLNQLGEARNLWINRSLIFTHGYGLALAEANRITTEGLPVLLIKDAPVQVLTPSLKVTRPQIYFGENSHEPVFVDTQEPEFDYPSGSSEVTIHYGGRGGFPVSAIGSAGAGRDQRRRLEHRAEQRAGGGQPDDDPPQDSGATERTGGIHHVGQRSLSGDHRSGKAGVDRRRVSDQRRASLFARNGVR